MRSKGIQSTAARRAVDGFGTRHTGAAGWNDAYNLADKERGVMTAHFHAWLVKTRHKVELRLLTNERHLNQIAPFAQAGMDAAETPADVPLVVIELARVALDVIALRAKLDLLNTYYLQAADDENESVLNLDARSAPALNALWDWFLSEREEAADDDD